MKHNLPTVILKKGKDKLPLNGHPWIFSGAIHKIQGAAQPGDLVCVQSADGQWIGEGHFAAENALIAVRILNRNPEENLYFDGIRNRIQNAIALRAGMMNPENNACRLIYSESDFLSGLVVDRFNDTLILQANTPGFERIKNDVAQILMECLPDVKRVIEKSDSDGRRMEHLEPSNGLLAGTPLENDTLEIIENGFRYNVPLTGQKTGFFTDQRVNRERVGTWMHPGMNVLDICCYTGGFSLQALRKGAAHVTLLDASRDALESAIANLQNNGYSDPDHVTIIRGNMFEVLRKLKAEGKRYDFIILDPPKLVRNIHQLNQAEKSYKDLNLQAMQLLNKGGFLATFSCSGALSSEALQTQIAFAAKDAHCAVQILETFSQAPDHPILSAVPESRYLKGFLCRIL